jgi:hypothetical protein
MSGVVGHPPVPPVAMRTGPCGDAPWARWAWLGLPGESRWGGESRWSALDCPTPPNSYNTIQ